MARQHGHAHLDQLYRLAVDHSRIAARIESGSWREAAHGVVVAAGTPDTEHARLWRAYLACSGVTRQVALGAMSAAWLHGVVDELTDPVEVVVSRGVWCPRPPGVRVREVSDWDRRAFAKVDGLLVTALPDTLVDVAPYVADAPYLTLLQEQCFGRVGLLGRVLARCHRGSKGSARARRVGAELAVGLDSPLHARGVRGLRVAGLAPSACDVEVVPGAGPSDCVYVVGGSPVLALEFDGDAHRLSRKAFLHDRAKDLALREAGCVTLRFTVEQVSDAARLVSAVRAALQLPRSLSTASIA